MPMTIITVLLIALFLGVGVYLIRRSRTGDGVKRRPGVCPTCRRRNARRAEFCAGCGARIRD